MTPGLAQQKRENSKVSLSMSLMKKLRLTGKADEFDGEEASAGTGEDTESG